MNKNPLDEYVVCTVFSRDLRDSILNYYISKGIDDPGGAGSSASGYHFTFSNKELPRGMDIAKEIREVHPEWNLIIHEPPLQMMQYDQPVKVVCYSDKLIKEIPKQKVPPEENSPDENNK